MVIIGGGPAGVGCALGLVNLSRKIGRKVHISIYEFKRFGESAPHYNQCVGVLSPPILSILEEKLSVPFPHHLVTRTITDYVLHSEGGALPLQGEEEPSYAFRRTQCDRYMLERARSEGVEVGEAHVVEVELNAWGGVIYSDRDNREAEMVVGAFGMEFGTAKIFERRTPYRQPRFLNSIVTKVHPSEEFLNSFGGAIHAFIPSLGRIEFGAITPKANHLTVNIAGRDITSLWMDRFLELSAVKACLPRLPRDFPPPGSPQGRNDFQYFMGRFPISVARGIFGDRYVIVGDAAGLVRPFKGKGINSGLLSGILAAEAILHSGVSRNALQSHFERDPFYKDIRGDKPYGQALRLLARLTSRLGLMEEVVEAARLDPRLREALFNCVSTHKLYRQILFHLFRPHLLGRLTLGAGRLLFRRASVP
ncbi:MAG: NAD(P)/FAD-dependent oxidoreductase [Nitrospinota bacterium]